MLSNIKNIIIELSKNAVFVAESEFGKGKGKQKKEMAIEYVVSKLPFPIFVKELISLFLANFIDDAIESAVSYMKSLPTNKGE